MVNEVKMIFGLSSENQSSQLQTFVSGRYHPCFRRTSTQDAAASIVRSLHMAQAMGIMHRTFVHARKRCGALGGRTHVIFEVLRPRTCWSCLVSSLRVVAELMVLLRIGLGMFQVAFTRFTFLHDPPARAPRGRSMPATSKAPEPSSLGPAASIRLEKQISDLTRGLQMMGQQLQTLSTVVETQQKAFMRAQDMFVHQQAQIKNLRAHQAVLPISPRGTRSPSPVTHPHARTSPFGASTGAQAHGASPFGVMGSSSAAPAQQQPQANPSYVGTQSTSNVPKLVLPGGVEIPLGVPSVGATNVAGTSTAQDTKPAQLDAFQRSDKWLPEMPKVDSRGWRARTEEIIGFETFLENFSGWLGLISAAFANEVKFSITSSASIESLVSDF